MNKLSKTIVCALTVLSFGVISASSQRKPSGGKIPSDLRITLERTMCFGTCPAYKLKIAADGTVLFQGIAHTLKKENAKSRISRSLIRELIKEFDRSAFMSFEDEYTRGGMCESSVTDMPSEIISIKRKGQTKRVNHYFGCRGKAVNEKLKPLVDLGKSIDRITKSKRWVGK